MISKSLWKTKEALSEAYYEAEEEGWDGYGANQTHVEALRYAWDFIRNLPLSLPLPEFGIDKDGDVAIEWDYGRRRVLSVRVGRDGIINYAGMDSYATFYGKEVFQESIPRSILAAIKRVVSADKT